MFTPIYVLSSPIAAPHQKARVHKFALDNHKISGSTPDCFERSKKLHAEVLFSGKKKNKGGNIKSDKADTKKPEEIKRAAIADAVTKLISDLEDENSSVFQVVKPAYSSQQDARDAFKVFDDAIKSELLGNPSLTDKTCYTTASFTASMNKDTKALTAFRGVLLVAESNQLVQLLKEKVEAYMTDNSIAISGLPKNCFVISPGQELRSVA